MKFKNKILIVILSFAIISTFAIAQNNSQKRKPQNPEHQEPIQYNPQADSIILTHEFRGAWVTTVSATDWPKNKVILGKIKPKESDRAQRKRIKRQIDSQQLAIIEIFTQLKQAGINALMFHTVSNSDAMYKSNILPWSAHLTGKQGEYPGYDPLAFAINVAHGLNMEIHAWLNPFRIGFKDLERADNHPYKLYPDRVQTVGRTMYWNPAHPDVVKYLGDICTELMTNYDLDGIHIDDYFYPEGLRGGRVTEWDDEEFYKKDNNGMTLERWREENVNKVVRVMYNAVHKANPNAIFSISPGGRLVNTQSLYADPQYWVEEGTIDFLAPQIYWQHGHRIADFKLVLDSWKDIMKDVPTVPGLAPYRWGEMGAFEDLSEYDLQIKECREASDYVWGNIWFTTGSILQPDFARHMKENFYKYPSLTPNFRKDRIAKSIESPHIEIRGNKISWKKSADAKMYAVYELEVESLIRDRTTRTTKTIWRANLKEVIRENNYTAEPRRHYTVLAIWGKDYSPLSNVVYCK